VNAMANDGAATKKKGSGRAGHPKSSAIDQHLEVAVEEAEKSLLQGQFRQALKDANRCLVYAATTNPVAAAAADGKGHQRTSTTSDDDRDMEEDGLCVRAPFYFPFVFDNDPRQPHHDRRPHTLCIRIDARPSDQVDRAAAVVLQSWYELSQRISEDSPVVQESHLRLLQPFWRAYASLDEQDRNGPARSSPRSCSLELVVVLVQFCRATFHVRESVELAMATLHHVLSSEDSHQLLARQWHHIQELLVCLFCRLLPYSVNDRSVELALTRLSEPVPCEAAAAADDAQGRNRRPHADDWILSDRANARAIRILVRFLENPPVHWPEECHGPLEVCREQLEAELARHPPDPRDDPPSNFASTHALNTTLSVALPAVPVNGIRDAASGQFEGLPTLGWDANGAKLWLCRLSYLAKVAVVEPFAWSNQRWSNRGVLAVSLWAFWAAWRRRARFYRISRLALRAVLQPIRDIIEALVSSSAVAPPTRR
jgi:hypothetical protein